VLAAIARILGIKTRRQFRLAFRTLAVVVGVASGFAVGLLMELHWFKLSVLPGTLLLVATLVEFVLGDYIAEQNYPIETEKKLALLEERLGALAVERIGRKLQRIILTFEACDKAQVSATVHIVVELTPSAEVKQRYGLLQLTDYVGPYGGSKGRITTLEKGIIGKCARTGRRESVNFADVAEYLRRMVEEFGFSKEEAERHTTIARSYLAEPLSLGPKIIGVLYFFTSEPQVFPYAARDSDLSSDAKDLIDILETISIV
jgi:hypothetical protein